MQGLEVEMPDKFKEWIEDPGWPGQHGQGEHGGNHERRQSRSETRGPGRELQLFFCQGFQKRS